VNEVIKIEICDTDYWCMLKVDMQSNHELAS